MKQLLSWKRNTQECCSAVVSVHTDLSVTPVATSSQSGGLVSSGAAVRLEDAAISCCSGLVGAGLAVLLLVMMAAFTLLDREGGHQGQVLRERLLLEPAAYDTAGGLLGFCQFLGKNKMDLCCMGPGAGPWEKAAR